MFERSDGELVLMHAEEFNEPGHVGALELVWQFHGHAETRDSMLFAPGAFSDSYRVSDIFDTDPVYGNVAGVSDILNIRHG